MSEKSFFLFFLQKFQVLNVKCGRSDIELRFCCFNIKEKSPKMCFCGTKIGGQIFSWTALIAFKCFIMLWFRFARCIV